MRLSRQIQKLATAPKGISRSPSYFAPSRNASTSASTSTSTSSVSTSGSSSTFIPDQPPHLSTSESLSKPIPKINDQGFFNASVPSSQNPTSTQPIQASQRETDIYSELQELVNKPSSYRSEIGSAKIWQKYISLSPAYRRTLPLGFLEKVFKYVIPNRKHLKELSSIPQYNNTNNSGNGEELIKNKVLKEKLKYNSSLGIKWERRLRTIASDIFSSTSSSSIDLVDPQIFINGLSKLALIGDKNGCELIIKELLFRYNSDTNNTSEKNKLNFKQLKIIYSYGLRSISKWLKLHSYRFTSTSTLRGDGNKRNIIEEKKQNELYEISELIKRLIKSMKQNSIQPNSTTAENLLNLSRLITNLSNDQKILKSYNELTELILINGYSLDLNNLSFGDEDKIKNLKPSVKLSIIDYFGKKGELYKMVAAFENLFPGDLDRLPSNSMEDVLQKEQEEDEDIPTLSRLIAKEQKERAERGWFGQRSVEEIHEDYAPSSASAESSLPKRSYDYNDYLPPIPSPYDILPPSSLQPSSPIHTSLLTSLQSAQPSSTSPHGLDGEGAVVSSVLSMLSRAWLTKIKVSPNDTIYKDISIHVLRLALRAAHIEQARFIYALKEGTIVQNTVNGVGPELRIEGNWFKAVWRTVRWTRNSTSRRGIKFAKIILGELENVQNRLSQERLILNSLLPETSEQGEFILNSDESNFLETIDIIMKMIKQIQGLELELRSVEESIHSNLNIAIERKTRSNSARIIKLEERKQQEALNNLNKSKRKGLSDRLLNSKIDRKEEGIRRTWEGEVGGNAVIA